jgi:predicted DNA-binding transcriptional regulator AlpA
MSQLLNSAEAAERLGLEPRTLDQWRYLGKGPAYVKLGRAVRYRPEALDEYIIDNTKAA